MDMPELCADENGHIRRRQRKLEQQRLLDKPSESEGARLKSPKSQFQHKGKSKHNVKSDRGKPSEKAQREIVRKKRQTSKVELRIKKAHALNDRKNTLAKVSLFAILAMHKMDTRLIHLASSAVRESLLLIFVHHLIIRGETVRRLVLGKIGDRVLLVNDVPIVHNSSLLRQTSVQSKTPTSPGMNNPTLSSNVNQDRPLSAQNTDTCEIRTKDDKVLSYWLKWAVKTFATSLRIPTDDATFLKIVRCLDHHVDKLINPNDEHKQKSKKSYRERMVWKYTAHGSNKRRLYPLLFNPQPLKRFFTSFAKTTQDLILETLTNGSFQTEESKHVDGSNATSGTERNSTFKHDETHRPSPTPATSIQSMKTIVSKTLNDSAKSFTTRATSLSFHADKSILDPSISIEEIDRLIAKDLEAMDRFKLPNQFRLYIDDFAERMNYLPSRLSANLRLAAIEPIQPDLANADSSVIMDVPQSVPILNSPISIPSSQTPETLGSAVTPSPSDKDLEGWTSSESDDGLTCTNDSARLDSLEHSSPGNTVGSCLEHSCQSKISSNLGRECQMMTGEQFFELIPLHTILLWEVIILQLQSGSWDCGFQEVMRQTAISLDVSPELYDALVAYAADLVAEAVANEMKSHCNVRSGSDADSSTISDASRLSSTNESRTLATTTPNTLRVTTSINKEKVLRIAGMALGIGALSALTAGLAAPAFAAGFGALGIAGTSGIATFLGSASGAASLASLFGASSASLSGWKYSRRLADIKVFEFVHLSMNCIMDAVASFVGDVMDESDLYPIGTTHLFSRSNPSISQRTLKPPFGIVIGISGWLNSIEDATRPWWFLADRLGTELFALKWEPQLLTELGTMMIRLVGENVAYSAASLSVQMTMAASAGLIMWPVSLLQYAGQLDNTWMTCRERAQQAGYLLALALCDTSLVGHRPVTLIGYSVGSRVITYCLRELYNKGEYNRVKDVVMMGLPGSKVRDVWRKMRSVVSGRLINVYCTSDWILAFLYRWMEWGVQVAGLSAIEDVPGVENFDATAIVVSHNNYEKRIPEILSLLDFHTSLLSKENIVSISTTAHTQSGSSTENQR